MGIPLQVADGKFAARCALLGNSGQELLGVVDSGSNATCVDAQTCKRVGSKFAGESADVKCVHQNHREVLR